MCIALVFENILEALKGLNTVVGLT